MKKHFYPFYKFALCSSEMSRSFNFIISWVYGKKCDYGVGFNEQSLLLQSWQRPEQVAGDTGLVRVSEELSVEVLVPLEGKVLALSDLVKCLVQALDVRVGHTGHAVVTEFLDTN